MGDHHKAMIHFLLQPYQVVLSCLPNSECFKLATNYFVDSLLETSISNSQPTITEKKIISLVVLNIFDEKQVFHLFTEGKNSNIPSLFPVYELEIK